MRRFIPGVVFVVGAFVVATGLSGASLAFADDPPAARTEASKAPALDAEAVRAGVLDNPTVRSLLADRVAVENVRVAEPRLAYVEGELWGVSAILRFDRDVELSGPWITVDDEALLRAALPEGDHRLEEEHAADGHDHDTLDEIYASGKALTAADYATEQRSYSETTRAVYVTLDLETGAVLNLSPFSDPPSAWEEHGLKMPTSSTSEEVSR